MRILGLSLGLVGSSVVSGGTPSGGAPNWNTLVNWISFSETDWNTMTG